MPDTQPVVRATVLPGPPQPHKPVAIETSAEPGGEKAPPDASAPAGGLSRSQILAATGACYAEAGYEGTTIRAIAGRLGCSVGSIYRYFQDKRQLLLACAEGVLLPAAEVLEAGEAVEDSAMTYAERAAGHGSLYRLMFWLGATEERAVPAVVERIIAGWAERLGDRGRAERRWAALHGALMLGYSADRATLVASGAGGGDGDNGKRFPLIDRPVSWSSARFAAGPAAGDSPATARPTTAHAAAHSPAAVCGSLAGRGW